MPNALPEQIDGTVERPQISEQILALAMEAGVFDVQPTNLQAGYHEEVLATLDTEASEK